MSASVLNRAAAWVARLHVADIPEAALQAARECIVDTYGVALAGQHSSVWKQCTANVGIWHGGPARLWGDQAATSAPEAAFSNAVAAHAWDFDDTSYAGIVHASAVVLPAAWAACESIDGGGAELLASFVAGVEFEYALGTATANKPYEHGYWATATLGIVGAAAASARALRLDAEATAHAIGLALAMPIGLRAIHGSTAKPYICGLAARLGLETALAARSGVQCTPHVLEHRFGFASVVGAGSCDPAAFDALGHSFAIVKPGVARKRYPLCSATQAAIEAVCELRNGSDAFFDAIGSIDCEGTRLVVDSLPYRSPSNAQEAQFSMQFALACAAKHGGVTLQHLEGGVLADESVRQLMERIALKQADTPFENESVHPEPARVRITFKDATEKSTTLLAASGMPQRPMRSADLQAKFLTCADFAGHQEDTANRWMHRLSAIDREDRPIRQMAP